MPRSLRFSDAGQEFFNAWWTNQETSIRSAADHPDYLDFRARFSDVFPALALVFQLLELAEKGEVLSESSAIEIEAAQRAAQFCAVLEAHARKIFDQLLRPAQNVARLVMQRVYSTELQYHPFSARDIYTRGWSGLCDTQLIGKALAWLAEIEILEKLPTEASSKGGAAPLVYRLP